jgi:hypothetical protein
MSIRPENWIEGLFASPAQVRLLRVLARDPSKWWTEREAGSAAGLPPSTGHLVFRRLHGTGVLELRRAGRSHSVRLRPELRLTVLLRELFQAEAATLEEMLAAATREARGSVAIYLFGSTARGEAAPESDLDLLVLGRDPEAADAAAAEQMGAAGYEVVRELGRGGFGRALRGRAPRS